MISNIIVFMIVVWAAIYSGIKLKSFIKIAGENEPVKCSCSSCPYMNAK